MLWVLIGDSSYMRQALSKYIEAMLLVNILKTSASFVKVSQPLGLRSPEVVPGATVTGEARRALNHFSY